jgi:hypothetical protein
MSIKYYNLAKDEEPPEEFCVVRDIGGEPSEYVFYVPEAENTKLRELRMRYNEYVSQDRCEGCVYKSRCNDGLIDECWQRGEIRELARELRIKVDE